MNYLMLERSNWDWAVDIFTFIGMAVSAIITLIAIVWLTCFFVRLLVKTFSVRVGKSYELMVEDINKKAEAKKERKEKKRQQSFAQKQEILDMKLESKAKIHEMKKQKLADNLAKKEKSENVKIFGAENAEIEEKPIKKQENKDQSEEKSNKKVDKTKEEKLEVEEPKAEVNETEV